MAMTTEEEIRDTRQTLLNIERDAQRAAMDWRRVGRTMRERAKTAKAAGRERDALISRATADLCQEAAGHLDWTRDLAKRLIPLERSE